MLIFSSYGYLKLVILIGFFSITLLTTTMNGLCFTKNGNCHDTGCVLHGGNCNSACVCMRRTLEDVQQNFAVKMDFKNCMNQDAFEHNHYFCSMEIVLRQYL